ncbi:MAG: S1C family serine protease, partial [Cyclobacteriaceae bacterium]
VVAVGNPFNLTSTVTAGIVSAKARNIGIINDKENLGIETFIQTDAAVNPGNSGGALVNRDGELIGINSAIASPTGAFAGYSFAVPVEIVEKVVADLKEYGEVQRALLGVAIADVTAKLVDEKKLKDIKGVYIAGVNNGSAAADAGIEEGDVIIKINDLEVNTSAELQGTVARFRPGNVVRVTYIRDDKERTTQVTLKNKLGTTQVVKKGDTQKVEALGAQLRPISEKEQEKYGVQDGVKVTDLSSGKIKDSGIKEGFVITDIIISRRYQYPVTTSSELVALFNANKGKGVLVEGVYSDGKRVAYALSL